MCFLARFGLGLCGLALCAAGVTKAEDPAALAKSGASALNSAPVPAPGEAAAPAPSGLAPASQAAGHHHKGLFGWRHCVECQRAWVKKHDGVDVPPPPSNLHASVANLPGTVVSGPAAGDHGHAAACSVCQAGNLESGPVTVVDAYPPGHAVANGQVLAGTYPPGHAISDGNFGPGVASVEPTPVGVSRSSQTRWNNPRLAATGPRGPAGPLDPSVQPSSMIPPQTALDTETTSRPHILSHLFGIGAMSRHIRESRDDKAREAHASISYQPPGQPVNELPASAVYGKGR